MIEKIINNYLTNALIKCFRTIALLRNIELYVISRKHEVSVYAKDRKYKISEKLKKDLIETNNLKVVYKKIMVFDKSTSIYYLCNLIETKKEFNEVLKKYQERSVNHG